MSLPEALRQAVPFALTLAPHLPIGDREDALATHLIRIRHLLRAGRYVEAEETITYVLDCYVHRR